MKKSKTELNYTLRKSNKFSKTCNSVMDFYLILIIIINTMATTLKRF